MDVYFFDSHGELWVTCDPNDADACASWPRRAARRIVVDVPDGTTPWAIAAAMGIVRPGDAEFYEFDTVDAGNIIAGDWETDPITRFVNDRGQVYRDGRLC